MLTITPYENGVIFIMSAAVIVLMVVFKLPFFSPRTHSAALDGLMVLSVALVCFWLWSLAS